jgi:peptide/nickel transport system permease protein
MSIDTHDPAVADAAPAEPSLRAKRGALATIGRELRKAPITAWFGMIVIIGYFFCACFAPWIAPFGEADVLGDAYAPWGTAVTNDSGQTIGQFVLGSDQLGRDILSRLIYGARNTIFIALATTLLSFFVGCTLGMLAAVLRGWIDLALSRVVDILMSIPTLIFALMLLTVAGSLIANLIAIIAVLDSTRVFRLSRALGMNVAVMDFVEAARLRGESLAWILRREVLPNILPTLVAEFGLRFCFVFLTIAALSFLGVGIQPPTADWGSMVAENATLISYENPTPLLPAGAIALLTVAVNFVVDWFLQKTSGLRDER